MMIRSDLQAECERRESLISDLCTAEPRIQGYLPNLSQFNEEQLRSILRFVRNLKEVTNQ